MALRTSSMNMPYSDPTLELEQERYNLPRKLVILLLLVVAASLWLYVLFHERRIGYGKNYQEIASGIILAIVAGLGAQLILSQRDSVFRFVAAMAADVAGVYLLGLISDGNYGISKFGWLPNSIDYDGLNLIGIGFLIIVFISLLFRRTKVIVIPEPIQVPSSLGEPDNSSFLPEDMPSSISISHPARPRISWSRYFIPGSPGQERSNGHRAGTGRVRPIKAAPVIAPKRRRRSRKARVQLALVEEHRCPYCLETVTRNDARGVVECTICHTLHHKDCWDITGTCQVPHLT
jgi:ribosomal protein L37AE/L43A